MDWAELDRAIAVLDWLACGEGAESPEWPRTGLLFTTTRQTKVSGYSRAKAPLDARMEQLARQDATVAGRDPESASVAPWRLHDARRTLATGLQRLGMRFEVTEAVLNRTADASRSGTAAAYQLHGWGPEKRAALHAWADHCDRLLNPADKAANVVSLRQGN